MPTLKLTWFVLLLVVLIGGREAYAQPTRPITGVVVDAAGGAGVVGATVQIKDVPGAPVTTVADGAFELPKAPATDVVLQVTAPRIPCETFKSWLDEPHWVKRFAAAGRPGAYLRVLTPGAVAAGDDLEVLSRPAVAVTVAESMQAYYGDDELMRRLLTVDGRGGKWDEIAVSVLSRA